MNLRRTPKATLDRDTPHVLEVEPPQCSGLRYVDIAGEYLRPQRVLARCLLPVNHDGPHQWGKG